ncbi:hypothetical protein LWC05_16555 [Acetobacter sicerae]|uniref:Uncharacterized protein n=1 Tax=Acetobacter sicerae TaxID=85325 RepID=A0ABS8VYT6_9PROT|nr:hypothetical protein [Acetobacter sicerae]MCE0745484.1 hypothetical protein [Acetobacter sicerae]
MKSLIEIKGRDIAATLERVAMRVAGQRVERIDLGEMVGIAACQLTEVAKQAQANGDPRIMRNTVEDVVGRLFVVASAFHKKTEAGR